MEMPSIPGNFAGKQRKIEQERSLQLLPPISAIALRIEGLGGGGGVKREEAHPNRRSSALSSSSSISSSSQSQYSHPSRWSQSYRSGSLSSRNSSYSSSSPRSSSPCKPTVYRAPLYSRKSSHHMKTIPEGSLGEEEEEEEEEEERKKDKEMEKKCKEKEKKKKRRKNKKRHATASDAPRSGTGVCWLAVIDLSFFKYF